jgi:hypothetical protein
MTGGAGSALGEFLRRRLELVQRLSLATSTLQRLQQARLAAEMDVQRCEMALQGELPEDVARDLLEADLKEAIERVEEHDRGMERCEVEIAALESSLAETDHAIATATRD